MAVYLRLFHGRTRPNEDMDDWGFDGPVLGPFDSVHVTYAAHIRGLSSNGLEETEFMIDEEGLVEFHGALYGDWSVFDMPDEKEIAMTEKILKCPKDQLPTLMGLSTWSDIYIETKLKTGEVNGSTSTKSSAASGRSHSGPAKRTRKSPETP